VVFVIILLSSFLGSEDKEDRPLNNNSSGNGALDSGSFD